MSEISAPLHAEILRKICSKRDFDSEKAFQEVAFSMNVQWSVGAINQLKSQL